MSDIHDPAHPDHPIAPGDQGPASDTAVGNERPSGNVAASGNEAGNSRASDDDDDSSGNGNQPGNGPGGDDAGPDVSMDAESAGNGPDAEDEDPADSIGNRIGGEGPQGPAGAQKPGAPGTGKGPGRRERGRKGGGGPNAGGPKHGGAGQGAGGDPNARRAFHVGDKVRAKIVTIGPAGAVVDLWGKEHGVLDLREVTVAGAPDPKLGDGVDVVVVQDGSRGGNLVVTRDPTRPERGREMIAQAFNANEPIEGLITGVNRGGLEVDVSGVRAFCPSSQIDVRFPPSVNPKTLVLTRQLFKVTSLLEDGREAIVSRRSILEQSVRARAEEARAQIVVGSIVKGIVVAVKEYGVFVDLGGIEGMIHISELTHNRGARPSDVVKVGEEIEAKVLKISGGGPRPEQHHAGAPAANAAASAPAEEAAHASESGEAVTESAPAEAQAGEGEAAPSAEAQAGAAGAGPGDKKGKRGRRGPRQKEQQAAQQQDSLPRVVLSRRAIEPDPWAGIEKKFPNGSVHTGKVARMQPFGAFVELLPGIDGLLHVSELGDGKRLEHPNEVLKDGQTVTVRVERVDKGAKRISLSLLPDGVTEAQIKGAVTPRVGMVTKAKIVEHENFGVWATIEGAVGKFARGLIPPPETNEPRGTDLRRALPVGKEVLVKVLEVDRGRLKLSIRAALQDEERQAYRAYQKEATSKTVGVSLADKLRALTTRS